MKSSICLLGYVCLLGVLSAVQAGLVPSGTANELELLIFHNNDMHARFEQTSRVSSICSAADTAANKCYGGFARVASVVREARKNAENGNGPHVLYLNAGDTYTGTIWFSVYKWKIAASFINILKPDAVSLGNHELDDGVSGLTPFIRNLTCPVLAANLNLEDEPDFKGIANLKNSIVLDIQNTKVGIIGYLTPDTQFLVTPNGVKYIDEVVSIQEEVNKLKDQGVNILIALGHSGYETDKRIAKEVQGIDLVIGGHTNTFLWNGQSPDVEKVVGPYPTVIQQASGKKVPVVQAYAYTKYLGKLHVKFDSKGELSSYDGQPILLDGSISREQDVLDLLETYRPGVLVYSSDVVGRSSVLLDAEPCRIKECNIGNFIADSMVYAYAIKMNSTENGWTDAPIALLHGGGIRSSIDATTSGGNVTRADLLNTLPFENSIVTVNMTGTLLKRVLEHSVYGYNVVSRPGTFLQVSGMRLEYNLTRPPGSRLMSAQALCGECKVPMYSTVQNDKYYKVLIPQFIFFGGDNYTMFNESASSEILTLNDAIIFGELVTKKSPIHPEIQGRIILHEKSGAAQLSAITVLYLLATLYLRIF